VTDGLSRLMGKLSRAVLRGGGHGDVFPLTRQADPSLLHEMYGWRTSHVYPFPLLTPLCSSDIQACHPTATARCTSNSNSVAAMSSPEGTAERRSIRAVPSPTRTITLSRLLLALALIAHPARRQACSVLLTVAAW
jgi:hypothetical protein